jgi:hypothetical protein
MWLCECRIDEQRAGQNKTAIVHFPRHTSCTGSPPFPIPPSVSTGPCVAIRVTHSMLRLWHSMPCWPVINLHTPLGNTWPHVQMSFPFQSAKCPLPCLSPPLPTPPCECVTMQLSKKLTVCCAGGVACHVGSRPVVKRHTPLSSARHLCIKPKVQGPFAVVQSYIAARHHMQLHVAHSELVSDLAWGQFGWVPVRAQGEGVLGVPYSIAGCDCPAQPARSERVSMSACGLSTIQARGGM